jgi:ribonuclease T1
VIAIPGVTDPLELQAIQGAVAVIDAGGPFPHARDGVAFKNREIRLPAQPTGYYQEYTVPTAGVTGRGGQRIMTGAAGELYYSADHYGSFARLR